MNQIIPATSYMVGFAKDATQNRTHDVGVVRSKKSATYGNEPLAKPTIQRPKLQPGQYTKEELSRGGINRGNMARTRAYDALDVGIKIYLTTVVGRVIMSDLIAESLPWIKDIKSARARYGEYIKAKLKEYEEMPAVARLGEVVDAIKTGMARKLGRIVKPLFASMLGVLVRVRGKISQTSNRFDGASWLPRFGCWGYCVTLDGECV